MHAKEEKYTLGQPCQQIGARHQLGGSLSLIQNILLLVHGSLSFFVF